MPRNRSDMFTPEPPDTPPTGPFYDDVAVRRDTLALQRRSGSGWTALPVAAGLVRTAVKTGAYTAAPNDLVPVDCSSGSVTVTLPTAPVNGSRVAVKLIAVSGSNVCTVARGGSADVFNKAGGATSVSLGLLNQSVVVQYDTGVWTVVSTDVPLSGLDARYPQKSTSSADQGKALDAYTGAPLSVESTVGVDAVGAVLPGLLPSLTPTGAVRRLYVRNDIRNPRAIGLSGWTKTDPVGSTGMVASTITDADLGSSAQYTFTHDGSASRTLTILFSDTSATYGIPTFKDQITFHRVSVKVTAQPDSSDIGLDLYSTFKSSAPAVTGNRVVQHKNRVDGAVTVLEGFDYAPNATVWVQGAVVFNLPAVAGTYTFVVGRPQTVVDPTSEVPAYGDGTFTGWSWTGTADQSASEGWVSPPTRPTWTGFNDNSQAANHAPAVITAAEAVALHQEAGCNLVRCGPYIADLDSVWPSSGAAIDWSQASIASYLNTMRANGMKACVIGGVPPSWMTGGGNLLKDVPSNQYANLARLYNALLDRWPDVIVALEWWNEPNLTGSWGGTVDAAKYTQTLTGVYPTIHAAHPDVLVLGGSLASYYGTDATGTDTGTFLAAMYAAGAKGNMDRISFHPYGAEASTAAPTSSHAGFNNGAAEIILAVREQRRAAADSATRLWVTEVGANTTSSAWNERQQAQVLLLMRGMVRRSGDVEAVIVHTLIADTTSLSTVRGYGLLEYQTLRRKPAWDALRTGHIPGGSWRPLTLLNSWTWYSATSNGDPYPAYAKDPLTNVVRFRLAVKGGTTATSAIASLPQGFRPAIYRDFAAMQSSAAVANLSGSANEAAVCRVNVGGGLTPVVNTSTTYFTASGEFIAEM